MIQFTVDKTRFRFVYLPEYAKFILNNKLNEFVTIGIRFSREADLPLLKPLNRFTEDELVAMGLESNRLMLVALSENKSGDHIEQKTTNWVSNNLGFIDKNDVVAEDITLLFYIRRKIFSYFLDAYTKNLVLQKLIIAELDVFTSQEELILLSVYLKMQQEKIARINTELTFHKELLYEAQELVSTGSFYINFLDENQSVYTPEYQRIFEMDDRTTFNRFIDWVHPDDRATIRAVVEVAWKEGGKYEVEYRYNKSGKEKRIWSKGYVMSDNGKPLLIRGVVREVHTNVKARSKMRVRKGSLTATSE